jgi:hypothetical protein
MPLFHTLRGGDFSSFASIIPGLKMIGYFAKSFASFFKRGDSRGDNSFD